MILTALLYFIAHSSNALADPSPWMVRVLTPAEKARMVGVSWHEGCPVARDHLRVVAIEHIDFDHHVQVGSLVVNQAVTADVIALFQKLRALNFPIRQITFSDDFQGDDNAAMAANATTAFNCRELEGRPGSFSKHSYGIAIDLNPMLNPYHGPNGWEPPNGLPYVRRSPVVPGMISATGAVVRAFEGMGWTWGGRWANETDYQHFDKRGSL